MSRAHRKAGRREWIGLAVLALPCLLYSMDLTVLNLAVPRLSAELRPTSAQLLWIVDIYGFLLAGALVPMGVLGDRIGRRRLLLCGACVFGASSVAAAFATSAGMLIAARAALGLAAATLAPSTLSLLRDLFDDPTERTFAVGVWIASFSAGGALGPVIGGLLLSHFWWGSVFLIAVPIMLLLLVTAPWLLPEYRDAGAGRVDVLSIVLSLAAALAVVHAIKSMAERGGDLLTVPLLVAGVALGALFIRRQRALAEPLIDLRLFAHAAFSASLLVNVLGFFVAFGSFLFIAQYLQLVLGLTPLAAGLWSAPSGIAFVVSSIVTPSLVRRRHPADVMTVGLACAAAGFCLLAYAGATGALGLLVSAYALFSLGLGPTFTLTTDLIVSSVPAHRAGMASGLAEASSELGGALGIGLLGSLSTTIYRYSMHARPLTGAAADVVGGTLAGALEIAATLPHPRGAVLAAAARGAFADGFVALSIACAAAAVAAALIAARVLRGRRRAGTTVG